MFTFHFPLDLERIIFEQAAFRDHKTALQLIRVSRSVCDWVEPSIYEWIPTRKTKSFLQALADPSIARSADFYAMHVKVICILHNHTIHEEELFAEMNLIKVVSMFTGLRSIALWLSWDQGDDTIYKTTGQKANIGKDLRPKRFSCNVERFFAIADIANRQPNFEAPFFSRLTHLEILDDHEKWMSWSGLELLPCLTHLELGSLEALIESSTFSLGVKPFIGRILQNCRTLEVMLFAGTDTGRTELTDEEIEDALSPFYDPRCVVVMVLDFVHDWDTSFLGHPDIWSQAEEKAREQRIAFDKRRQRSGILDA